VAGYLFAQKTSSFKGFELADKAGKILRDHYEILGAWTVLDPKGNQMHLTYASPGTAEYYRQNKKFPDGAVLVKEINGTDHAQMTTGDAHWATGIKQWFVLIKDEKHRFPNNPLWGDGWGWALFKADAPDKQVATTTKKTASTATFRPSLPTGYTSKAIRSSNRNENPLSSKETHYRGDNSYETDMARPFLSHRGGRGQDFDRSVSAQ
jgi:hypothetical protein